MHTAANGYVCHSSILDVVKYYDSNFLALVLSAITSTEILSVSQHHAWSSSHAYKGTPGCISQISKKAPAFGSGSSVQGYLPVEQCGRK